jgi:hypothetical protein
MTRVMSESLERKLSWRERATLRLHLWVCLRCMRYLEQLFFMRKTLRSPSAIRMAEDSAPTLSPEACERIKRRLEGAP